MLRRTGLRLHFSERSTGHLVSLPRFARLIGVRISGRPRSAVLGLRNVGEGAGGGCAGGVKPQFFSVNSASGPDVSIPDGVEI